MAACILARICRGRLHFRGAYPVFLIFAWAVAAWAAVAADRLSIVKPIAGSAFLLVGRGAE